jgi:drug/metabolite transporter (DMT)-like permease
MEQDKKSSSRRWAEGLIVLQSIVYGFGDPISKIAFEVTPVYTMMSVRYLIAFVTVFLIFRSRIINTVRTVPVRSWLIPGMCVGLSYLLNNVAQALTDATSVAFLRSLSVVITPAFAFMIYRSRYRWQHTALQVLVLPGMYLLCVKGGLSGFGAGEVIALAAAALMAAALVFTKNYLDTVDPASMTSLQAGCSAVLALIGCVIFEGGLHLETTTGTAWLIILYLAITCTFLGYLLQNMALTRISDREVSLIQSLNPVMTAVFSFILLGEKLSAAGIAGAAIIIACISVSALIRDEGN